MITIIRIAWINWNMKRRAWRMIDRYVAMDEYEWDDRMGIILLYNFCYDQGFTKHVGVLAALIALIGHMDNLPVLASRGQE